MNTKIIFITGSTCSGKTSLQNYLLKNISKEINLIKLHTTRIKREEDKINSNYIFDTLYDLKDYIISDKIYEKIFYKTNYGNWYYYTLKEDIKKDKLNIIAGSIDTLSRYYQNIFELDFDITIIPIYLYTDYNTMKERYNLREKDDKEMDRRIIDDYIKYNSKYSNFINSIIPEDNIFKNTSNIDKDLLFKNILNRINEII